MDHIAGQCYSHRRWGDPGRLRLDLGHPVRLVTGPLATDRRPGHDRAWAAYHHDGLVTASCFCCPDCSLRQLFHSIHDTGNSAVDLLLVG